MKHLLLYILLIATSFTSLAQSDVTKFLGFPVDGSESTMIRNLKAKGFTISNHGVNQFLKGRFNGVDVHVFTSTEKGKVSRIMVCDENTIDEGDIKIRFNRLCNQFTNNGKYLSLDDYTISDNEDISYEMAVHNKRYEAIFYQLPEEDALDNLQMSILQRVQSKYSSEQLENASEELKTQIFADCATDLLKAVQNKPVWFMITEHFGKYYITMFYDNELNRAQGEDL